jgi:hypothetical protein
LIRTFLAAHDHRVLLMIFITSKNRGGSLRDWRRELLITNNIPE